MSAWPLLALFAALAAMAVVCHRVASTKRYSDEVLREYTRLLGEARELLARADEESDDDPY